MMRPRFPAKVPTWVWSFLIKVSILAMGVGWVILVGFPLPGNHTIPEDPPVLPLDFTDLSVQTSVVPGGNPLPPRSTPTGLPADFLLPQTSKAIPSELIIENTPPLDINQATREELERLPGLGAVLVQRILAYRQENGPFQQIEELQRVRGIGHKRLQQLRPLIRMTTKKA